MFKGKGYKLILASIIGLGTSFTSQSANAATVFSDLASYNTALGFSSTVDDDFNDFASFIFPSFPLDRGSYQWDNEISAVATNSGSGAQNIDGTGHGVIGAHGGITFNFDDTISQFAFEAGRSTSDGTLRITSGAFTQDLAILTGPSSFLGIIFDDAVSSISFLSLSSNNIGFDNFRFEAAAVNAVPEPGTMILSMVGGLFLFNLKRRSQSNDIKM